MVATKLQLSYQFHISPSITIHRTNTIHMTIQMKDKLYKYSPWSNLLNDNNNSNTIGYYCNKFERCDDRCQCPIAYFYRGEKQRPHTAASQLDPSEKIELKGARTLLMTDRLENG